METPRYIWHPSVSTPAPSPATTRHLPAPDPATRLPGALPTATAEVTAPALGADLIPSLGAEDGSLVTEYGLLAVVAATLAGVVIQWASSGAMTQLFNALLRQARSLVGA